MENVLSQFSVLERFVGFHKMGKHEETEQDASQVKTAVEYLENYSRT